MADLSSQIRTYFDAVADPHRAAAIETTSQSNGRRTDRARSMGDIMTIDVEPKHDIDGRGTPGRSRRSVAVALVSAAALVVAVVALVVAMQEDAAEQVPTDQPEPVAPDEAEPRPTDPSSGTEGIMDDVEVGEALVGGLDAGDAAAVVALFRDDAIVELSTARSVDEIPRVMDYWALEGAGFTVESCAPGRSYSISCDVGFTNAWVTEADEPVVMELQIQVDGGRITQIGISGGSNGAAAIEPYWAFLGEQHPDDLPTLIADDPDSPAPLGPSLTDESLVLHERYIAEFVAQRTAARDVEVGEALVDGLDAGDAAAVVALFRDDAIVELSTARSVDEIPRMMDYWALEGAGFTVESCAPGRSYSITCDVGFTNAWVTEADEPVVMELQIQVDDGRITQIGISGGSNGAAAIEPYWAFLGEQHPDDLATLIADDPDSPAPLGPSLTDESLALHERYIAEFVAQRTNG